MALLCVLIQTVLCAQNQRGKLLLLLINPDRHDTPLPDKGEKSSDEVIVRTTAPFLAARLTFKTLFETLKNKRYACTILTCASCLTSLSQRCSGCQSTLAEESAECWWVWCEAMRRACSACRIIPSTHVFNKTLASAVPHRIPHHRSLFPSCGLTPAGRWSRSAATESIPPGNPSSPHRPHYKWECVCNFSHPSATVAPSMPSMLCGPSVYIMCHLLHQRGIACCLTPVQHLGLPEWVA